MMIDLNPRTLPVHCCCDPQKRFGWVRVEREHAPGRIIFMVGQSVRDLMTGAVTRPVYIRTEIARLVTDEGDEVLAVKSNDHPIEQWRKVAGFIEDRSK